MVMVNQTTWDYYAPPVGEVTEWDTGDTEWDAINDAVADINYSTVATRNRALYLSKLPGPVRWPLSSN